ncbi:MAG: hypothetical protein QM737_02975 [Ferruginibacter sp.]
MKHYLYLFISTLVLASSCKKNENDYGDTGLLTTNPVPIPIPALKSFDDTVRVFLKDIQKSNLPSPYYHFEYDNKYARQINFASGFSQYVLEYQNKRLIKMLNSVFGDRILYTYNNNRVSLITEFSGITGFKHWEYYFGYNNRNQLAEVRWIRYDNNGSSHVYYRKAVLSYHPDGNLAGIENWMTNPNGQFAWTKTVRYEDYDNTVNVDSFGHLKEFFETLLYLPAVQLQKNNHHTEVITTPQNDFRVTYTYLYNNGLPVKQTGIVVQTRGTGNPQPVTIETRYSYY